MRPDIREQSLPSRAKTGVLAIGEGSIYGRSNDCCSVIRSGAGSRCSLGKFQFPLDCLEARLVAERIQERIGLHVHQVLVTQPHGRVQPL